MDAEHLEYFKAALEGRATIGWNVWFAANQQALSQQLSRPALLRLKFNQLDEAERLLAEAGIVPASMAGKRNEMYCAQFSLDVLDEKADRCRPSGARRTAVPSGYLPMANTQRARRSCLRNSAAPASAG